MKKKIKARYLAPVIICVLLLAGVGYYYLFTPFSRLSDTTYLYVDGDDTFDSLCHKLQPVASRHGMHAFCVISRHSNLTERVRTGRYAITTSTGAFSLFRKLRNGSQDPVSLVVPSVRTMADLAGALSRKLMVDSATWDSVLTDEAICRKYGYDTATIAAMFIPNTYDIYWNITPEKFLDRMEKEHKAFWNDERSAKAKKLNLTPVQVSTLASIVDEETANDEEKPMVAGMYYNRLTLRNDEYPNGMPLQADPTIKFALKDFGLKRIYHSQLLTKSPYNTYINTGLPPGPIRIPSVKGIDAVLNMARHHYLYMCAKEDFSGTHNFAVTYAEHMQNAKRYADALNKRGIK